MNILVHGGVMKGDSAMRGHCGRMFKDVRIPIAHLANDFLMVALT